MEDRSYDAIVIGGGHNGLVAGFYLARAGLRALVLERRDIVGGACTTEEFAPGYRASVGAYVLSMLREQIWRDMDLVRRGIVVDPAGPTLNVYPDGAHYYLDDDMSLTLDETRRFSERDARALPGFEAELASMAEGVLPAFEWTAPDPRMRSFHDLRELAKWGRLGWRHRKLAQDLAYLFTTSANQFLSERFESEHVKAALGWHAINDSTAGPSSAGTAYVLLHDHASEESGGGVREWGFVRGGMGALTATMADAAREAGCEIRTGAEVDRVVTRGGRATGVRLASGEELRAPRDPLERRPQAHVPPALRRGRSPRALPRRDPCLPVRGDEHQDQPGGLRAAPGPRPAGGRRAAVPHRHHGAPVVHARTWTPSKRRPSRACRPTPRTSRSASRRCTTRRWRRTASTS